MAARVTQVKGRRLLRRCWRYQDGAWGTVPRALSTELLEVLDAGDRRLVLRRRRGAPWVPPKRDRAPDR
ncbi:hypothetical protein Y1Q_0003933 [Alligator mississippiensis]|uniref:Uncharacterized protein n=1 Tax=Alligator mississippiensis TaxID=8496 RepID=A0A151NRA9_ALLMI|nr:hypothetical protein Y1Q_0003933 [Alligator mississippiensis]